MHFQRWQMRSMVSAFVAIFAALAVLGAGQAQGGWRWYMTDPHVHSAVSADAYVDLGIISTAAQAAGYDALFLTDHGGGSSFHISYLTANHMAFEDTYTRWETGTYGSLAETVNALVSSPVRTGSKSLRLKSRSNSTGESYIWASRGPNFRSGDIILQVAIYPVRIDPGSGVYVSASIGGDPRVQKDPYGYTTESGVVSPGKSTVLVWQLGNARTPDANPDARVLTYNLGAYTLNAWNVYTINVSQALQDIPPADRPVDYNGLTYLKLAAAANGGTAEAYFDSFAIDASAPVDPADEFVYRNGRIGEFNTADFSIFPSAELGQQRHTQRFNFGFLDRNEFKFYQSGSDSIPDTHGTGYPAQLNHPGVTISTGEVVTTEAHGADFVEAKDEIQIDAWDSVLKGGTQVLGHWSSDTHTGGFGSKAATFLYAPAGDIDTLMHAMYEGRSYAAYSYFEGRVLFNLDGAVQEPYPARYPVFVSDAATAANVHLEVTDGVKSSYSIRWIVNDSLFASDTPSGTSYAGVKAIPLAGPFTYVRTQVNRSSSSLRALSQPIFFVDVASLPASMRYHVTRIDTPSGRAYHNGAVRGIVSSVWSPAASSLDLLLANPAGATVQIELDYGSSPQRIRFDGEEVAPSSSRAAYDSAATSSWFYDGSAGRLYLRALHSSDSADVLLEYGAADTTPPTPPANLTVTGATLNQVDLAWSAASDAGGIDSYLVSRDGVDIATVSGTTLTYADTTVAGNTTYQYTVSAVDPSYNRSHHSNVATVTTPATGTYVFPAQIDAYVDAANSTRNYGSSTSLRVDASPDTRGYLRFAVEGVPGTVVRAWLRLYAGSNSNVGYQVRSVGDNNWTETELNYNNAPGMGSVVVESGAFAAGAWTEVDVTGLVTGYGDLNLAVTGTSNTGFALQSREGSNPPQLVVEVAAPGTTPTPTPMPTPTPGTPGVLTFTPAEDAYVSDHAPDSNYGAATNLRVDTTAPVQRSYLRFNLQGISGSVTGATLRVFAASGSSAGYEVRTLAGAWSETTVTFNTAPDVGATPVGVSNSPFAAGSWTTVDVTSLVAGDGLLDLAMTGISSTAINFNSREGANPPQLVVELDGSGQAGAAAKTELAHFDLPADSVDTDGDGAPDAVEMLNDSNILVADTDGDGLLDLWEIESGLSPNDAGGETGAEGDPDGDGVTNLEEQHGGTDPLHRDDGP